MSNFIATGRRMDIKEQWRKLRECHREALRRQYNKTRRAHGLCRTKMWMYQRQMEFLLPFMAQRGPEGLVLQGMQEDEYCTQLKMEESSEDQPTTSEAMSQDPTPPGSLQAHTRLGFKRKARAEDQDILAFGGHRQEEFEGRAQQAQANDSLYHFFMCMYNTARNMPIPAQLRLKKRIFDVVVEAEEEMMDLGVHHMV